MSSEVYHATMASMREKFRNGLSERINEIELSVLDARMSDMSGVANALDKCHALTHKLAGAAGTFGYPSVAEEARRLEQLVKSLLEVRGRLDDDSWRRLDEYLLNLKNAVVENSAVDIIAQADWRISAREFGPVGKSEKTVLVVDDDIQTTDALRLQLTHFGYRVIVSNNLNELPNLLEIENPNALVLDISFPGDPLAGINMAKELRANGKINCPLIFISVRGELEVRLEAIRVDADGYFAKPIVLTDLLQNLQSLINPEEEEPYRVVVVDDDHEVANFNAAALNEAGIVTVVVTDPMKVMPPIRELRPDLILMDLQMPGCTGFELARSIRYDKTYVQTPIVFLTGSDIADTWLKFVKSGGDELLRKTISTRELVAIVHARCKRSRQLQRAMDDLRMSEARFRSVAQTAQEAIVTTDGSQRIVFWNPAAENLFGYNPDEILGRASDILFVEKDHSGSGSWSGIFESQILRQDSTPVPVEISTSEWDVDGNGFLTYIFRDITEQKEAREQLIIARDEAESANKAKSEFLSAMSHDLRTPLNSILGFVNLMLMDDNSALTDDQRESLDYIRSGGTHLLDLINQVLDLSAVETGNITLDPETIPLRGILEECTALIRISAENRGIEIHTDIPSDNLSLKADRKRLKEVLLNLMSNAVKYNNEGGSIRITGSSGTDGQIRITVADTGPGIAEEDFDRLFAAFDRLGAESSSVEGTGIGLTIVKRFVEIMDGSIGVESVVGEGSQFWFELPASAPGTPESNRYGDADILRDGDSLPEDEGRLRILCIEDNPANMRLLQRIFATRGDFSLLEAKSGEDGLILAAEENPDIILLDIGLPGMDGFEVLEKLRDLPQCADTPVIALSANAMKHDVTRGREAGFFEYLTKPVNIDELILTVNKAADTDRS